MAACNAPPVHATANTATSITQTWFADAWLPSTTPAYSATPSTTTCVFRCDNGYPWDGTACSYVAHVSSRCGPQRITSGGNNTDWYWVDSLNMLTDIRTVCGDVSRGINCSDQDGCCAPAGVSINGHCVVYAGVGEYCYASPQCQAGLNCDGANHVCYQP
jgi:hypothetical protein